MLRIFREMDLSYQGGGGYEEVIEETPETPETPAEVAPAATVPQETQATPEVKPETKAPDPVVYDWKKEIKNIDRKELFAELGLKKEDYLREAGLDDFELGLLDYKSKTGDLTPYLEAKTVDYTKLSAEDILKLEMKKANLGISEKALNIKFNKELAEKYYLDREVYPEGSDEAELGQELLRLDSERTRKAFIEEQSKFKAPEPKPDTAAQEREAAMQQQREKVSMFLTNHAATANLKTQKSITIGEGEESFNYPIEDVEGLVGTVNEWLASNNPDLKGVDVDSLYLSVIAGADPKNFLKAYRNHISAVEKKKIQTELGNETPTTSNQSAPPPEQRDLGYR